MIRLGLCCKFLNEPIRFRTTTATAVLRMDRTAALRKISGLCLSNARALQTALEYCAAHGIGDFRVNSRILPVKTHPDVGYAVEDLPDAADIVDKFQACGAFATKHDLRLTFHPDQFVLLNSPRRNVTDRALADLEYHAEVADWIGADVINIHGGGAYGDKTAALGRLRMELASLPGRIRSRLTLENDDRTYTPAELLPVCREIGIPFVYDIHHHRCLPDGLSVDEVTERAVQTWEREPLFHVSSPKAGWDAATPHYHHDLIDIRDFPDIWRRLDRVTVEVEAKAKERAVLKLKQQLGT